MIAIFALAVRRMVRVRRRGRWRPGAAANAVIGADVLLFGAVSASWRFVLMLLAVGGLPSHPTLRNFSSTPPSPCW